MKIKPDMQIYRWTVLRSERSDKGKLGWWCRCECGTERFFKNIGSVSSGHTKSCGCLRKELLQTNNPMFNAETVDKVSKSILANPKMKAIQAKAVLNAQSSAAKESRIKTNNDRYGGNSPAASAEVTNKTAETNLTKYGSISPAGNIDVLQKMVDTTKERYGVDNIMELDEYKEKVSKAVSTTRREKGITMLPSGIALVDACKANNKRPSSANIVKRKYGLHVAEAWINTFDGIRSSLEQFFYDALVKANVNVSVHNVRCEPVYAQTKTTYYPDLKVEHNGTIAYIDADGLYFHSQKQEQSYHLKKAEIYRQCNTRLFQFREDEILYKTDIVVSMIKSTLGLNARIGARKCKIVNISDKDINEFMLKNHLMGPGSSAKGIALTYNNEIVMVLTYRKYGEMIDISRVATALGNTILGGLSKLLNYLILQNNPKQIQSFVDFRYANGHSLLKTGFHLESMTLGWQWTDKKVTYNRLYCVANMDERNLSEAEYAAEQGLAKIYDAGQAKFIKNIGAPNV